MQDTANIALARRMYAPDRDAAVTREIMSGEVVWDITPGFPYGGVYRGFDAVVEEFLGPLSRQFASLRAEAHQFLDTGDSQIVVFGAYHMVPRQGDTVSVPFVHLWTVRGEKLAHLRQIADSHLAHLALLPAAGSATPAG